MKSLTFSLVLVFSMSVLGQAVTYDQAKKKAQNLYDYGNNAYAFGKYSMADSLLKLAIECEKNFVAAHWLLGIISLENQRNSKLAVASLKKVEELNSAFHPTLLMKIGEALFRDGQYDEAKNYFQRVSGNVAQPPDQQTTAKLYIRSCDFAKEAVKNPVAFKPENLGDAINSSGDDLMPALTADEHWLYFTRMEYTGRVPDENIYVSENRNATWRLAEPVSEMINTLQYNEGAHSISQSGRYLFFTSCDRPDKVGGCDIYYSKRTGNDWDRGKNLWKPINSGDWESQPYLAGDGRTLYFVSTRKGGYGGMDIYKTVLSDDGKWSEPENLGPEINTPQNEQRPFIHPDGFTLYFSSDGHPGMGKQDLFMARKQADGKFGKPINMGYPINTAGDEIGVYVTVDGKNAYFASEQPDTKGGMDIYRFAMPQNLRPYTVCYVKGRVVDKETSQALGAQIKFIDLSNGQLYSSASSDTKTGEYLVTLPTGKNYASVIQKEGYLFYSANFSLADVKEGTPYLMDIALQKMKVGERVVLNNTFYETNSYALKEESKTELNTLIELLQKNATMKIEIGGHTDNSGLEKDNQILSTNRAKVVYEYLIANGITADRLSYKGYSATKPLADNETAEGKAKNRRTEFLVIDL